MISFQLGDYAETDRHYGKITWDYGAISGHSGSGHFYELHRLECLHGPQKESCTPYERVFGSQLKPVSPMFAVHTLGEDYFA